MSKIESITEHYLSLLKLVGEEPDRDGLRNTPQRAAKAMAYLTQGYEQSLDRWSTTRFLSPIMTRW